MTRGWPLLGLWAAAAAAATTLAALGQAQAQPAGHWNGGHWVADGRAYMAGDRVERGLWYRSQPADWRLHRLRRPPHGYQWRRIGGFYVLAAISTGLVYDTAPVGSDQFRVSAE